MTPTRELALQITKECKKFSKPLGLRVVCVYGGTGISEQVNTFQPPGSVDHLMFRKALKELSCLYLIVYHFRYYQSNSFELNFFVFVFFKQNKSK